MSLANGKAPGIDGIPVEFYKAFRPVVGEDMLEVFQESFQSGFLPQSCRRAVITLLPKKGDLQDLKNWRPVSLLCMGDYKVLSKALALRLREVMAEVVHVDQTYCVPGRLISDNIHLIRHVLDVSGSLGIGTGLISIDQEKAFDRVEHQYLWKTLAAFGFSPGFIARIQAGGGGPPSNLLSRVQAILVNFFWDRLHWLPQAVLFLPKEEGGQGLVHLASRGAAFRLQFIQRLLYGPQDLVWRPLAQLTLRSVDLEA
ncbi:hypothetical protein L3Q82_000367 [Scortum barcoo]|uniref:Uncharacterized protein n=1 Tax=Scortum barcoo TaxID=214431 RepID=A0ACB8X9Y9_9TELE|nr:hypothetical protein L3Q82_000367 [Scortum barcoo]